MQTITIKSKSKMKKFTVNIMLLVRMKASLKKLTMEIYETHLRNYRSQINGRGFKCPEQYPALLRMFLRKYSKNEYDLFQADVPLLLTWHNQLTEEINAKPSKKLQDIRSALAAYIEFVMHSFGIDITRFGYTDALEVYAAYKNRWVSSEPSYAMAA